MEAEWERQSRKETRFVGGFKETQELSVHFSNHCHVGVVPRESNFEY